MSNVIINFLKEVNCKYKNLDLFLEALTHPSAAFGKNAKNYQRLEFLGDSVLSMFIAGKLVDYYQDENEGMLSKRHAYLVSGDLISKIAQSVNLGQVMIFSKNEEKNSGRDNKRNLENGFEALIGAIYLDSGFDYCGEFIDKYWHDFIIKDLVYDIDPVSRLQEIIQSKTKKLPKYQTVRNGGNEHDPIFTSVVEFEDQRYAANGSSKKDAQKKAAKYALEVINNKN
ncbi:ribonuclease III [Rickettsiales bacterium]|nr:ribonuclease III [Rickettsiales bacterium]